MKSFTDISQSQALAEILPLESADMHYVMVDTENEIYSAGLSNYIGILPSLPCWSLTALLDVLPALDGRNANFCKDIHNNQWHVYYHSTATLPIEDTERYNNLIDACYEMILKLHKDGLL